MQELVEAGVITPDDAAVHPERHIITRALGGRGRVEADFFVLPLVGRRAPDAVLRRRQRHDRRRRDRPRSWPRTSDPRDAADQVVAAAVAAGGRDNATAVVVDVVGLADDRPYDSDAQRVSLEQKLGALP